MELRLREKQKEDELRRREEKTRQAREAAERLVRDEEERKIEAEKERELAAKHGEYEYNVSYFRLNHEDMASQLQDTIKRLAAEGWEYMQVDQIPTHKPPGCPAALLNLFLPVFNG